MSSSFLSALTRAKENTRLMMENATAQLSTKLQISLNSTSSVTCTSVSIPQANVQVDSKRSHCVPQMELPKPTTIPSKNSASHSCIKYTDPVIVSTTSTINVKNSDVQNFVISKSAEIMNVGELSSANTSACNIDQVKVSLHNQSSTIRSRNAAVVSISTPSTVSRENLSSDAERKVNCSFNSSSYRISDNTLSKSYSCSSRDCKLPSCASKNSTYQSSPLKTLSTPTKIQKPIKKEIDLDEPGEKFIPVVAVTSTVLSSQSRISPTLTGTVTTSANIPVWNSFNNSNIPGETFPTNSIFPVSAPKVSNDIPGFKKFSESNRFKFKSSVSKFSKDPKRMCIFCHSKEHSSHNCWKFSKNSEFWEVVYKERLCKNCLRPFHFSQNCFDTSFCYFSNCRRHDKHSPILCKFRYFKSKPHQENYRSKPRVESYQDILQADLSIPRGRLFYSQGTQTDFVEFQTVQTQTIS